MKPSIAPIISLLLIASAPLASAVRMLTSNSLQTCQDNSSFSATQFQFVLTPGNGSLSFNINGVSSISGNVTIELIIDAYGIDAYKNTINPCDSDLHGLCPMNEGPLNLPSSNTILPASDLKDVPGIAYTVPDLDASVTVYFYTAGTKDQVACVRANLSNGKTVDQTAVAWVTAIISGLALVASAITSGLGHSNTAAHVAANALSLFGYYQAQAFIGMTSIPLPPIVASWTQNFQWSMGIIRVGFLQNLATWYQRSTGGTPSLLLSNQSNASVLVQKRGIVGDAVGMVKRAASAVAKHVIEARADDTTTNPNDTVIVKGIQRVGFRAGIELTNIFLTGYIFFLIFVIFTVLGVVLFKFICEGLVKAGHMKGDKFQDFRNGWTTVLKGILYRIVLIGFPQMVVLCFWEFTQKDSGAEIVLAVFTIFPMMGILGWAASKVIRLAHRSIAMHKNPAYILYSDPVSLNKWGFLYVQFKASAYFFIVPVLVYVFIKGIFIGVAQSSGAAQAIALVIIEAGFLIAVSVLRPYMDKKTNAFNIAICSINFVSALFLLIFSNIFNQPQIANGVLGVVFFVYNAIFSTVLLIIVLVASIIAITAKNPDTRYQPMRDDRGSFIKSQSQLNTELDALGATARGENKHGWTKSGAHFDEDADSWSGESSEHAQQNTAYTGLAGTYNDAPRSPINTNAPSFPSSDNGSARHMPPGFRSESPYSQNGSATSTQQTRFRQQGASPSPWQRGAGYE